MMKRLVSVYIAVLCLGGLVFPQKNNEGIPASSPVPASVKSSVPLEGVEEMAVTQDKKISLDIKGMDIVDVLKMLALRADLNVVVGKNVRGQVSMFLRDVDIWDAFEIILLANDLAYDAKGNIINVMTQDDYEKLYGFPYKDKKAIDMIRLKYAKAKDIVQALLQIKSDVGKVVLDEGSNSLIFMDVPQRVSRMKEIAQGMDIPLETQIYNLNYADAKTLSDKIKPMLTKGLGSIKIDERVDKVVVTDTPDTLKKVENVIMAFDEKPRQVLIDAQIIELKPSDKFEMGIDWDYWIDKYFRISSPFSGVSGSTKLSIGTVGQTVSEKGQYKAIIDALRTLGDTKILSSPRIMVVDNQEASILVGSREAYLTSSTTQVGDSASTTETVNFVDVGIKLYVTPQVSRDDFITMKIRPEVSSSEFVNFGTADNPKQIPIVTTSEAETTVVVKGGTTLIIGGLRKDTKTKTVKKIPLIGDIPFFGALARNVSDEVSATDLVILLTPHLVSGKDAITDFSEIPPKEGLVVRMNDGNLIKKKPQLKPARE